MINKLVVNHLCPFSSFLSCSSILVRNLLLAITFYHDFFSAFLRTRPGSLSLMCDELGRNCRAHRAGCITRASYNWVHYVHQRSRRRYAFTGNYRNLSSTRRLANPSQREKSFRFSVRSDIPHERIARAVTATRFSSSCRLIDDASFYELNPL